jgi:hypothetical protein
MRASTLEPSREVGIGSYFRVNLDESLRKDSSDFAFVQGILKTIPEEEDQGKRFTALVRSRRC